MSTCACIVGPRVEAECMQDREIWLPQPAVHVQVRDADPNQTLALCTVEVGRVLLAATE